MRVPARAGAAERIPTALAEIEAERNVAILFAAESGSRAWGFASPDSDWDVRFVYVRPARDYLCVSPPRDVIELPLTDDGLDVNGWDLLKALRLFRKSNPPLLEWLGSPLIYRERGNFASGLRALLPRCSPRRIAYHYLSLARNTWENALAGQDATPGKKYLYALRPLVCLRWLEQGRSLPPPTALTDVLAGVRMPAPVLDAVGGLLERKRREPESRAGPRSEILDGFITGEIERFPRLVPDLPDPPMDEAALDAFAWKELGLR